MIALRERLSASLVVVCTVLAGVMRGSGRSSDTEAYSPRASGGAPAAISGSDRTGASMVKKRVGAHLTQSGPTAIAALRGARAAECVTPVCPSAEGGMRISDLTPFKLSLLLGARVHPDHRGEPLHKSARVFDGRVVLHQGRLGALTLVKVMGTICPTALKQSGRLKSLVSVHTGRRTGNLNFSLETLFHLAPLPSD